MAKLGDKKKKKSKKFDYFDAFEEQAALALKEIKLIRKATENFDEASNLADTLEKVHAIEHTGDELTHQVWEVLLPDFVTPIDREDIITLTDRFDTLIDKLEEIYQSFYIYDIHFMHHTAPAFLEILERECEALQKVAEDFRDFKKSKTFDESLKVVFDCEEEADALYLHTIRNLYTHDADNPVRIMVWHSIFNTLEDCADEAKEICELMRSVKLKLG
jgi:predicted phosphate transport protein (TIGR00153 family)